jgi:hypothetical protein
MMMYDYEEKPPQGKTDNIEGVLGAWRLAHELRRVARVRLERMALVERIHACLRGPEYVYHEVIGYAIDAAVRGNYAEYKRHMNPEAPDDRNEDEPRRRR